jgi:hypothetical protein
MDHLSAAIIDGVSEEGSDQASLDIMHGRDGHSADRDDNQSIQPMENAFPNRGNFIGAPYQKLTGETRGICNHRLT